MLNLELESQTEKQSDGARNPDIRNIEAASSHPSDEGEQQHPEDVRDALGRVMLNNSF